VLKGKEESKDDKIKRKGDSSISQEALDYDRNNKLDVELSYTQKQVK
jgi:hypothetical protein